jgi:hypothetical protein
MSDLTVNKQKQEPRHKQEPSSPKPFGNTPPKLAINLLATAGGEFEVRSCEVLGSGYRNRTSFQRTASIDEVFVSAVALGLAECLAQLSRKKEVISLPEFKIEAPGLALGQAHILVSEREGEQISVIVRFQVFLGNLDSVLCEDLRPLPNAPVLLDKLANEVLFDITLPILNICTALDLGQISQAKELSRFLESLAENAEGLKFRTTLLKRFLEDIAESRCAQPPRFVMQAKYANDVVAHDEAETQFLDMKCV